MKQQVLLSGRAVSEVGRMGRDVTDELPGVGHVLSEPGAACSAPQAMEDELLAPRKSPC